MFLTSFKAISGTPNKCRQPVHKIITSISRIDLYIVLTPGQKYYCLTDTDISLYSREIKDFMIVQSSSVKLNSFFMSEGTAAVQEKMPVHESTLHHQLHRIHERQFHIQHINKWTQTLTREKPSNLKNTTVVWTIPCKH